MSAEGVTRTSLCWQPLVMGDSFIPASEVVQGEYVRLLMDAQSQMAFLSHLFPSDQQKEAGKGWNICLKTDENSYPLGSSVFYRRIGSMIRHRGLLANLSLRENLLLPFLYRKDAVELLRVSAEVEGVAEILGITELLDQRAGERSDYIHALLSLGRCLLARSAMVIVQEVHIGMSPDLLLEFRAKAGSALRNMGAGLLYLTESAHEESGFQFARTLTLEHGSEMMAYK